MLGHETQIVKGYISFSGVDIPTSAVICPWMRTTVLQLGVAYGARYDPIGSSGIAHLLEHVLISNPTEQGAALCQKVERVGGFANATTGVEEMNFVCQVAPDDGSGILESLCQSVVQPVWSQEVFDQERNAVLRELEGALGDPRRRVRSKFLENLFNEHPLANPVQGKVNDVARVTLDQMIAAHSSSFLDRRMLIVVIGPTMPYAMLPDTGFSTNVSDSESVPLVNQYHAGSPPAAWPGGYSWAVVGSRAAPAEASAAHAFVVLGELLGSSPSSLLYQQLRIEQGLAYEFESWYRGYQESGSWRVFFGAEQDHGPAAVGCIVDLIDQLANKGPADEHLVAAKRRAQVALLRRSDVPLQYAQSLLSGSRIGAVDWDVSTESERIASVKAHDIMNAATAVKNNLTIELSG